MHALPNVAQPRYSVRLLQPFVTLMRERGTFPEASLQWLATMDPEERVHVASVNTLLEGALRLTDDPLIGLKATAHMSAGDVGIFDFIMSSASTVRAAMESAGRYMRLLNDAASISLHVERERARVQVQSSVLVPPAAEDFGLCGLIRNQSASWPEGMLAELEVWFLHAAPADVQPYVDALETTRLHFGAPVSGLSFPARYLDLPLRHPNPKLHDLLLRYAEAALASLPKAESVTERVRQLVVDQLASGNFSLDDVAHQLHMSSRTLGRRLADEGTTFKNLVDDLRRSVALRLVAGEDLSLSEVALLAGFNETPSFYRAFRRWTGMTPSQYRQAHRGDLRGLR